jgi:3-mercaptopyruvate sulfurtransferase SseA
MTLQTPTIDAAALAARLDDRALTIVDVRSLVAYNGWRQGDDARGGHIPGAVAFPVEWLETVDAAEIQRLLTEKGLDAAGSIVVYGASSADGDRFAGALAAHGATDIAVLDGGFSAWIADGARPVDKLLRHDRLVHIDWLAQVLAGEQPEAAPTGKFLLFHVNFGVPEEYAENHLPGALYLDTNWLEASETWNRRSPAELEHALRSLGITRDTTVVVYGRDTEGDANEKWPGRRAGQIAATRALMILTYAGIDDVRLLDGGYDWWVRAGHPLETIPREPSPIDEIGVSVPLRPDVIVDLPEAKQVIADPEGAALVSIRTWREHIGAVSGYNYIGPAGRIKGDVWGNCGSDAYHMQHYRNIDNTMRPYPEISANWAEAGIVPGKWVAFYCGTGWRASETWFYAFLQGWPRVAVYDGGWFEWSADPDNNPIEIGDPTPSAEPVT